MISEKRSAAARANGARSRGPKTPEGKARSSRNATRHGLLSKSTVLPGESLEAYQHLLDGYIHTCRPACPDELGLVRQMVDAIWRLGRAAAVEADMIDAAFRRQPAGDHDRRVAAAYGNVLTSRDFSNLQRQVARLQRLQQRAFHALLARRKRGFQFEPKNSLVSNSCGKFNTPAGPTEPGTEPNRPARPVGALPNPAPASSSEPNQPPHTAAAPLNPAPASNSSLTPGFNQQ